MHSGRKAKLRGKGRGYFENVTVSYLGARENFNLGVLKCLKMNLNYYLFITVMDQTFNYCIVAVARKIWKGGSP